MTWISRVSRFGGPGLTILAIGIDLSTARPSREGGLLYVVQPDRRWTVSFIVTAGTSGFGAVRRSSHPPDARLGSWRLVTSTDQHRIRPIDCRRQLGVATRMMWHMMAGVRETLHTVVEESRRGPGAWESGREGARRCSPLRCLPSVGFVFCRPSDVLATARPRPRDSVPDIAPCSQRCFLPGISRVSRRKAEGRRAVQNVGSVDHGRASAPVPSILPLVHCRLPAVALIGSSTLSCLRCSRRCSRRTRALAGPRGSMCS